MFVNLHRYARSDLDARVERVGNLMTASWMTNDEVCVLAGPGDEAWVRSYLE